MPRFVAELGSGWVLVVYACGAGRHGAGMACAPHGGLRAMSPRAGAGAEAVITILTFAVATKGPVPPQHRDKQVVRWRSTGRRGTWCEGSPRTNEGLTGIPVRHPTQREA